MSLITNSGCSRTSVTMPSAPRPSSTELSAGLTPDVRVRLMVLLRFLSPTRISLLLSRISSTLDQPPSNESLELRAAPACPPHNRFAGRPCEHVARRAAGSFVEERH